MYITGGEKDVLSLSSHGFNAICLNSETAKVPDDLLTSLRGRFNNIVILYDTDETGRREAAARVGEMKRIFLTSSVLVTTRRNLVNLLNPLFTEEGNYTVEYTDERKKSNSGI